MSAPLDPAKPPTIERAVAYDAQRRRDLVQMLGEQYSSHPAMTPLLALIVERMYAHRLEYLKQGRGREAWGAGQMIEVLWHTIVKQHKPPKPGFARTVPADLEGPQ